MKTIDEKQIQSLLDKFMEGETTIEEENLLGEYFRTNKEVRSEWESYKSMFDYFDKGMPYGETVQKDIHSGIIVKMIVGAISAAAIVTLLFTFTLPKNNDDMQLAANDEKKKEMPAKSNTNVEKKEDTSKGETTDSKTEEKINSPIKKAKKKRAPRLQFSIPVPQEYMAQTSKSDSLNIVDKELINSYLHQCASMDVAMEQIYADEMDDQQEDITYE